MEAQSLAEVRDNIDRLDKSIIALMAERGGFVRQAARFKSSRAEVEAPKRVEDVIKKVCSLANEAGLESQVAEAAYRAMIAAFVEVEDVEFLALKQIERITLV